MEKFGAVSAEINSSRINNSWVSDSKLGFFQQIKIRIVIKIHDYFIGKIGDRKKISKHINIFIYVSVLELFSMRLVTL